MVFCDEIHTVLNCSHFCFKLNFNEKFNTKKYLRNARALDIELHAKKVSQDSFFFQSLIQLTTFNIWCYLAEKDQDQKNASSIAVVWFWLPTFYDLSFSLVFHWNSFSTKLILHLILKIMINIRTADIVTAPYLKYFLNPGPLGLRHLSLCRSFHPLCQSSYTWGRFFGEILRYCDHTKLACNAISVLSIASHYIMLNARSVSPTHCVLRSIASQDQSSQLDWGTKSKRDRDQSVPQPTVCFRSIASHYIILLYYIILNARSVSSPTRSVLRSIARRYNFFF